MDKFVAECEKLNLAINSEKSSVMVMSVSNRTLNVKIRDNAIESVIKQRYLGITIDRSLTFGAHIRLVREKVQERLCMLKVLNGAKKGAHPDTMLKVYQSLIRSTMEYGCSAHNNASKTSRRMLEVINNQSLRKATGSTKSTPLNTLSAISGQPPIEFRQEMVTCREIARCLSRGNVLGKQLSNILVEEETHLEKYSYMEQLYLHNKASFDMLMQNERIIDVDQVEINAYLGEKMLKKDQLSQLKLKQHTLGLINGKYKGRGRIWTDASKDRGKCGIGIFVEGQRRRYYYRLQHNTSITSAELTAIWVAMQIVEEGQLLHYVVLTDSRSSCQMLESGIDTGEGETVIAEILRIAKSWRVSIQWVPSHIQVSGNDVADMLAKEGTKDGAPVFENKLLLKDLFLEFTKQLEDRTKRWYEEASQEKGKKFYAIQPTWNAQPWFTKADLKGKDVRLLNRLMSGHDYSKYWLAKMKLKDDPNCDLCDEHETAEHVILHCPRFGMQRQQYSFDCRYANLEEIFKTGNKKLFEEVANFVKEMKLDL